MRESDQVVVRARESCVTDKGDRSGGLPKMVLMPNSANSLPHRHTLNPDRN